MAFQNIIKDLANYNTNLVAVSKTKPQSAILKLYEEGQRDFGENRVQELVDKQEALPKDIKWHMIGHLQSNKVKYIAPFIHLIHSVDSPKILKEINKQAAKNDRIIDCLLQFHIAEEDTKYGFDSDEALAFLKSPAFQSLQNIRIVGVMGMATFTKDENQVRNEFRSLKAIFDLLKKTCFEQVNSFKEISMGMSGDYNIAMEEGSTMVRIGSLLFGARR
ncbi:MAG: YggS family pyridoxal phosphate-dependent enzyme [Saprospiraceae bacterium]|nr:YggS family pyridoxal phosphate-dependent enzyme [Saprospiraceae bacterium]